MCNWKVLTGSLESIEARLKNYAAEGWRAKGDKTRSHPFSNIWSQIIVRDVLCPF
jgi:hypothetical protein